AFKFQCPKRWENLKATRDPAVRYCDACDKAVHFCHTLPEAQSRARAGECVAVRLDVLRYPDDLKPRVPDESLEVLSDAIGMLDPFYEPPAPRRPWWKFW
ncbi:MAG: hypothetical protein K2V38_07740, partial [Gemmataceae bacterium]|nr:hypothetical protein [Gemmataceae bacterium]